MPRRCSVCSHGQREAIDRAIVSGEAYRAIAGRYGLSRQAVQRHADAHVPSRLAEAHEAREVADAGRLLGDLDALRDAASDVYGRALNDKNYGASIAALREQVRICEVLLRASGQLGGQGSTLAIFWAALTPAQEARRAAIVAAAQEEEVGHARE